MSDPKVPSWVMLFEDVGYKGRHLTIRCPEKKENLKEADTDDSRRGFNDKASSVIYCIAEGVTCQLFEDKEFQGRMVPLKGTGDLDERNLKDKNFHGKTSSVDWDFGE